MPEEESKKSIGEGKKVKNEIDPFRKRLLIATDNFLPRWDGIARFLSEIIPRLKSKFDITVIAPDFGPYDAEKELGVKVIRIPVYKIKLGDFSPAKVKSKLIKREVKKTDIVFSQTIGPIGYTTIRAARRYKKKVISFMHSIEWELVAKAAGISLIKKYIYNLTKSIARKIYNKSSLLIVPAENITEVLTWQRIRTKKKIIHLGVDTQKFVPPDNKLEAKKRIGINAETMVIGNHGRLGREKDLPTLLRAFISVRKNHPNTVLLIVGEGVDSIKKKLSSVQGVMLPGGTNNVVPYLQAMDIYCLPSLTETTSLATLEAMACGVPVLATKVGFVKDYIKQGVNGLFFRKGNSYELAREIELLLKQTELRRKIGAEARRTVEREFDWNKTAREIEETIEKMLEY